MAGGLLVTVLLVVSMCLQPSLQVHPSLKNIALRDAQGKRLGIGGMFYSSGNLSEWISWNRKGAKGDCFFISKSWNTPRCGLFLTHVFTIQKITVHACENDVDSLRGVEVSIDETRVGLFPSNHTPALVTNFPDHLPMEGRIIKVEKTSGLGEYFSVADVEVWAYQCDDSLYYGDLCDQPCGSGCKRDTCDSLTGNCWAGFSVPCRTGYKSMNKCDQVCNKGSYGSNCKEMCSPGCLDGACNNTNGHCQCLKGWTGQQCDVCNKGSYGSNCEEMCGPGCLDGACNNINGHCQCLKGWTGQKCDAVDVCRSNPCDNGGRCQGGLNSYTCLCLPGFTGHHCEQDIDDCQSDPCGKGGHCSDGVNSYTCQCLPGFSGHRCEQGCEAGRYGYHCSGRCGRCRYSDQCDVITGDCPAGCEDGFHGTRCDNADDSTKFYIVVGVAATVIALVAVAFVLLCRSRRAGQVPRTGGVRTEHLDLEEAGTQDRSPEQKMDSNRPTLPGEEQGFYSDVTSSTGLPSAGARARVPRLQPQHCHQEKTGEKAAAMPAHILAGYDRPGIYKNTTEDTQLYKNL